MFVILMDFLHSALDHCFQDVMMKMGVKKEGKLREEEEKGWKFFTRGEEKKNTKA